MLVLRASCLIPVVAIALRVAGIRRVARVMLTAPRGAHLDDRRAALIGRAVHRAARIWPVPPSCLTRAIVIARLLSREGLHARITVGVSRAPFAAHAWIEHGALRLAGASPARRYASLCAVDAGEAPVFVTVR